MKKYIYAIVFSVVLAAYTAYTLLDAFVIPHDIIKLDDIQNAAAQYTTAATTAVQVETTAAETADTAQSTTEATAETAEIITEPIITDTSYKDSSISITITSMREYNTDIHVADVVISDISYLKTGLANGGFGRNLKEQTSEIAEENNAIFAVNGDFYGFRSEGFVERNGYLYRTSARTGTETDALVIYADGSFEIVDEKTASAEELVQNGALQIFSFGPGLVEGGEVMITSGHEVENAMTSNPRTAIGIIEPLHYIFVVSDGRTDDNVGLSLVQLADVMQSLGCDTAYNLDGGGSATMWFNGNIVNYPTTYGELNERSVSDIVYIG